MPTLRKDKDNRWMARIIIDGKQIACKTFPPGKKYGPEWRAAKEWEEQHTAILKAQKTPKKSKKATLSDRKMQKTLAELQEQEEQAHRQAENIRKQEEKAQKQAKTQVALEKLFSWGEGYLEHAKRTMSHKTHVEKKLVMRNFFTFCSQHNILSLNEVTAAKCYTFLADVHDTRGANVANKYRKNMLAAWTWGMNFIESFPQERPPFQRVKMFAVEKQERYVPSDNDVIKVLQSVQGQDLVMLLLLYFTGARRGEAFRLVWDDIDFKEGKIRLRDHKAGHGQSRIRWLRLHPELLKALACWEKARPCKVDNVFMQTHCDTHMGKAFKQRRHFMEDVCTRGGVKPFGFHAIRHKSAAITFVASGLNAAQILMGHYRATTTDTYTKSAGLYADHSDILSALGDSGIGQVVGDLLKTKIPQGKHP